MPIPIHLIESSYPKYFPAAVDVFPVITNEEHYIDAWILNSAFNSILTIEQFLLDHPPTGGGETGDDILGIEGQLLINIPPACYPAYKSALAWDSNLLKENIKEGITVFGVTGTHEGPIEETFAVATGGNITTDGDYKIHTFTENGSFIVTTQGLADCLIVGGGGAGGGFDSNCYGEGGGGGQVGLLQNLYISDTFTITIGLGGIGNTGINNPGSAGGPTIVTGPLTISAVGGLPGGATTVGTGGKSGSTKNGGTGGGAGAGYAGGGGGGDSANGNNGTNDNGGDGGTGTNSSITGILVNYGHGGGGASDGATSADGGTGDNEGGGHGAYAANGKTGATDGTNGLGTGGGGYYYASSGIGKNGGNGVVIFRYKYQ